MINAQVAMRRSQLVEPDQEPSPVPRETYEPMLSGYLSGGYRDDEFRIDGVDFCPGRLRALCSVQREFVRDGDFLLSSVVTLVGIEQLAILYAHLDSGFARKESFVYLREVSLRCVQAIRKSRDITFELRCTTRRHTAAGSYYAGDVLVEDGAYVGHGAFILPTLLKRQ